MSSLIGSDGDHHLEGQRFIVHGQPGHDLEPNPVHSKKFPTFRLHKIELSHSGEGQIHPEMPVSSRSSRTTA